MSGNKHLKYNILRTAITSILSVVVFTGVAESSALGNRPASPFNDPLVVDVNNTHPSVATALQDQPIIYTNGCHARTLQNIAIPCHAGATQGEAVIVALGDSHLGQWYSALDAGTRFNATHLEWLSKSGCPAIDVTVNIPGRVYTECDQWRHSAFDVINHMARVDMVIVGQSYNSKIVSRESGSILTGQAASAEWQRGLSRLRASLPASTTLVIVRDTPHFLGKVPNCLLANAGQTIPCGEAISSARPYARWGIEVMAAKSDGIVATDPANKLCTTAWCGPVASDNVLRYRDSNHLTNAAARQYSAHFATLIRNILAGKAR